MDLQDPTHHLMEKSTKLEGRYFLTPPLRICFTGKLYFPSEEKGLLACSAQISGDRVKIIKMIIVPLQE